MALAYETVLVAVGDGVAWLTLNRPEKRNAMSPKLHVEMTAALEELRYDPAVRVVVITGAGTAFCAGMDLKETFVELGDDAVEYDRNRRIALEWRGRTLRRFPKPTIAMVNGYCFGGAFSIVEGCDLAVAAKEATFGLSEINFGLLPGGTVSKTLANILRPRDAMLYALTGRHFSGDRAAEIGFVNYAVPLTELRADVTALAAEIATKSPAATHATKDAYRYSIDMDWDTSMAYTEARADMLKLRQGDAWREVGIGDFLDKKYRPGMESHPGLGDR